jgi:hypothetical protein
VKAMSLRFFTKLNQFLVGIKVYRKAALLILHVGMFEVVFNWNGDKLKNFNINNK